MPHTTPQNARSSFRIGLLSVFLLAACSQQEPAAPETSAPAQSPPVAATPAAPATDVTVFEGARIITGDTSAPIENGTFIIENDRFVAVGATGSVDIPAGATRVDLSGATVMPTIIDTHVH